MVWIAFSLLVIIFEFIVLNINSALSLNTTKNNKDSLDLAVVYRPRTTKKRAKRHCVILPISGSTGLVD